MTFGEKSGRGENFSNLLLWFNRLLYKVQLLKYSCCMIDHTKVWMQAQARNYQDKASLARLMRCSRATFHSISKVVILGLRLARGKYHYGRFWMRLGLVALLGLLAIDDTVVIPCPPELWARSAITSLSNNHAQNWWKMIIEQHLQRRSRLSWHQHEPKWCHENSWKTLGEASLEVEVEQ